MKRVFPPLFFSVIAIALFACSSQSRQSQALSVEEVILENKSDFYSVDFSIYKQKTSHLPVGIFDSGTGGLTVLNALLEFDEYVNGSKTQGPDGVPDFEKEKFIYLADQANMPYGLYYSENNTALLLEHIIKDTQFLLSNKYYVNASATSFEEDKEPVKLIVVACNTATAYGLDHIRSFIKKSESAVHVIGVIDAGARGALEIFSTNESGSIGVLATVGTIASAGYEKTLRTMIEQNGLTGHIEIFGQGGHGIAEAVDQEPDFVDPKARGPRRNYRGPSWSDPDYTIDKALLDIYNFDRNALLCDSKNVDDCNFIQLNSAENYVRYHVVSLLEKIRLKDDAPPLKALILGCTHYPYLENEIREVLAELYNYRRDGAYVYRNVMSSDITLIDPSKNVARELFEFLEANEMLNDRGNMNASEFYISVPNSANPDIETDRTGRFTYEYKYGRVAGGLQEYVRVVPFSRGNITDETLARLKELVPTTYYTITCFNRFNPKTAFLRRSENSLVIH